MKFWQSVVAFAAGIMLFPCLSSADGVSYGSFDQSLIELYGKQVYTVNAYSRNTQELQPDAGSTGNDNWCRKVGTAFSIDHPGYMVTFQSVVTNAHDVFVFSSEKAKLPARVIETQYPTKVSVLAIDQNAPVNVPESLPIQSVLPGQDLAFLSMVNYQLSVVHGTVKETSVQNGTIIVDVPGHPGTSGTPVFDEKQNLIGFLAYQVTSDDTSDDRGNPTKVHSYVVLPAESVSLIAHSILNCVDSNCGWLGIASSVNETNAGTEGILVKHVIDGSPADKIGLLVDDCIFEFNGKPISSPVHLVEEISATTVGDTVSVKFMRNGKIYTKQVTLSSHPFRN